VEQEIVRQHVQDEQNEQEKPPHHQIFGRKLKKL
jgi:hypothetical protein